MRIKHVETLKQMLRDINQANAWGVVYRELLLNIWCDTRSSIRNLFSWFIKVAWGISILYLGMLWVHYLGWMYTEAFSQRKSLGPICFKSTQIWCKPDIYPLANINPELRNMKVAFTLNKEDKNNLNNATVSIQDLYDQKAYLWFIRDTQIKLSMNLWKNK